ncbi:MAG: hypothetical protein SPG64_01410 [Candidatus Enteromonas sp.]|nr:hypothetical protein [Candidatus Enteromonas sp.]
MKAKSKILLALSVLTAGTLAAGATSTFAWFTTTRAVQLTYSKVTVLNDNGSLEAALYPLTDPKSTSSAWSSSNTTEATSSISVSEISSKDGKTFSKPVWKVGAGGDVADAKDGVLGTDFIVLLLELKNTNAKGLDVYLDLGTGITANPDTPANKAAAALSRVAVYSVGASIPDSYAAGVTAGKDSKSIVFENGQPADFTEVGNTAFQTNKYFDGTTKTETTLPDTITHVVGDFTKCTSDSLQATQKLATDLKNGASTQYFYVAMWLEGTKTTGDYFNSSAGGLFNVNLNLVAFDAA